MNITDLFDLYNVPYKKAGQHHHTTPGFVSVDCPHCSPNSGRFRLGFNLTYNYFSCWSCGGRPLIPTLMDLLGENYSRVKEVVGKLGRERLPDDKPRGKLVVPDGVRPLTARHKDYLAGRGYDPDQLQSVWGIQSIGLHPRLCGRLYIPIFLPDGRQVSWTTRSTAQNAPEGAPRYLSASPGEESVPHRETLYGADKAKHAVVVVEGPADAWAVGPGAVCTFGLSFTRAQVLLLSRYAVRAVCFDREAKAQRRARELCSLLQAFPGETVRVDLETGGDPGDADEGEIVELRRRFLT